MVSLAEALGLVDSTPEIGVANQEAAAADELDAIEVDDNITLKELLKRMLETKSYRRSIYMRLITGTLPPAVECKIFDHVMGKPVDRIEIEDTTKNVDGLSLEELHERHQITVDAMRKILAAQQVQQH